ncbi:hypothetical protein J6590_083109 [Homalodisca vitripennis]|nr:hypothetical protein J6590_083109 [Homalodisca vitripennis]
MDLNVAVHLITIIVSLRSFLITIIKPLNTTPRPHCQSQEKHTQIYSSEQLDGSSWACLIGFWSAKPHLRQYRIKGLVDGLPSYLRKVIQTADNGDMQMMRWPVVYMSSLISDRRTVDYRRHGTGRIGGVPCESPSHCSDSVPPFPWPTERPYSNPSATVLDTLEVCQVNSPSHCSDSVPPFPWPTERPYSNPSATVLDTLEVCQVNSPSYCWTLSGYTPNSPFQGSKL